MILPNNKSGEIMQMNRDLKIDKDMIINIDLKNPDNHFFLRFNFIP